MAAPAHIDYSHTAVMAGVAVDAAGKLPNGFLVSPLALVASRTRTH
jgi:hypothetical protein